jgi:nucleotide-binding universal stress UspA family protein
MGDGKLDFGALPRLLLGIGAEHVRGQVLLALRASEPAPFASLHRSAALSASLRTQVHVLRVMGGSTSRSRSASPPEERLLDDAMTMHAVRRSTRTRLGSLLGQELPWDHHRVDSGPFVETVSRHAAALGARFVVLPARDQVGETAVSLVRRSGIFVLVARSMGSARTILARTESDSVDTILKQASSFDADLIITRMKASSWMPSALASDAVSQLVDRAAASVLLAPPGRSAWPALA